jgi:hypothetical protein
VVAVAGDVPGPSACHPLPFRVTEPVPDTLTLSKVKVTSHKRNRKIVLEIKRKEEPYYGKKRIL